VSCNQDKLLAGSTATAWACQLESHETGTNRGTWALVSYSENELCSSSMPTAQRCDAAPALWRPFSSAVVRLSLMGNFREGEIASFVVRDSAQRPAALGRGIALVG
jgi:hypothetical protein